MLATPEVLALGKDEERFALEAGDVVVPPAVGSIEPVGESARAELSGLVSASVDDLDRDPGADARLTALLDKLDPRARGTVLLALAWHALRVEQSELLATRTTALRTLVEDDAAHTSRATAAGLALLLATQHLPTSTRALAIVAQGLPSETGAVIDRLRELGDTSAAQTLSQHSASIATQRRTLRSARTLLGVLDTTQSAVVLSIGGAILVYHPRARGAGEGALFDPLGITRRIRDESSLLVTPASGTARSDSRAGAIDVVPGALAIEADSPAADRSGPLGLLLVFAACAAAFVGGLFAVRRALLRERDAMRLRSEFLTSVTHELRTPIAAIRLLAERLGAGKVRDATRRDEYHAMLATEAARLGTLVENVLDLGRMDRGERSYDKRAVRLGDVIEDTVLVFGTIARAENLDFVVEDRCADEVVVIDRGAVQQSLLNLCDNARKYGRGDGPIELTTAATESHVTITVRDHGPGVPLPERTRIFDRFVRGETQRAGAVPGVGLGLHLSRAIAEAHGGTLELLTPDDGHGASFVLRLPRDRGEPGGPA